MNTFYIVCFYFTNVHSTLFILETHGSFKNNSRMVFNRITMYDNQGKSKLILLSDIFIIFC